MSQRIARVVRKIRIRQQEKDSAYWKTRPYAERLAALEEIRRAYHKWKYGHQPRFERVYRTVKR